jgi:DNA uptake protein ComE-like DNA-binding protein
MENRFDMHIRVGLREVSLVVLSLCLRATARAQEHDRPAAAATSADAPPPAARIDINHASERELMQVPGMTRSWAGRILRYRPYRTKQDLLERGIVTSEVYDRLKDFLIAHKDKQ